jgi:hypothetical protein
LAKSFHRRDREVRFGPLLAEHLRRKRHQHAGRRWYVDETYIAVKGQWAYLYRAIDSNGQLGLRPPETVLIDERHRLSSGLMGPLRSMPADFPKVSLRRMVLASCSGFLRRTTYVRPVILAGCVQVRSLSGGGGAVCT